MKIVNKNSALISNTMLCEVSRLLAGSPGDISKRQWRFESKQSVRLADLLSLIEAVSLHETLYTLPARLDKKTDTLELRNELVGRGIVQVLDTSDVHEPLSNSILLGLSKVQNPVRVAGSESKIGTPIDFDDLREKVAAFLLVGKDSKMAVRLDDSSDYFEEEGNSSEPLYAPSLEECGRSLIGWLEYGYSGTYQHCTSILRDMYYVLAAEAFGLAYWPQSSRREFTSKFPNYLTKTQMLELYSKLANEFKSTVTEIFDDHKEELTFVPPFASLVLSRSAERQEIIMRLLEVRDEYADLRLKLGDLESERLQASSIGKRLKLRKQQRYLLGELASAFERPSTLSLEGVVRYVPQVVKPVMKPSDPASYSADLLLLPIKQLVGWWKRRPISKFFDLADKLKSTEDYPNLVKRLFGSQTALPDYDY